jgi:cytochrome c
MKRSTFVKMTFFAAASLLVTPVPAAEFGIQKEAVAMVKLVQARLKSDGKDKTYKAITNKEFNDRDLYPFVYTLEGVSVAHGANAALVGKNMIGLKDPNGVAMVKQMSVVAQSGQPGWVDYKWPNPLTNKIDDKTAYIERAGDVFIGVGIYR